MKESGEEGKEREEDRKERIEERKQSRNGKGGRKSCRHKFLV